MKKLTILYHILIIWTIKKQAKSAYGQARYNLLYTESGIYKYKLKKKRRDKSASFKQKQLSN